MNLAPPISSGAATLRYWSSLPWSPWPRQWPWQPPELSSTTHNPNPCQATSPAVPSKPTQTTEFGDHIVFGAGPRELGTASVVMSSWACESGATGAGGNCLTTPGETFNHPITLNLYEVDATAPTGVGALITSVTQTVAVPFRPSATPACHTAPVPVPGGWQGPGGLCFNGFAFTVDFDLAGVTVPDEIIFSIAFNTSTYGNPPVDGTTGPYDSLNVGLVPTSVPPVTGTDADTNVRVRQYSLPRSLLGFRAQFGARTPVRSPV